MFENSFPKIKFVMIIFMRNLIWRKNCIDFSIKNENDQSHLASALATFSPLSSPEFLSPLREFTIFNMLNLGNQSFKKKRKYRGRLGKRQARKLI